MRADLAQSWIPIVLVAALAQTARNSAQRALVDQVGTLGATLARFAFGLPFAILWVVILHGQGYSAPLSRISVTPMAWLLAAALTQLAATAFLLLAMEQRNFVVAIAYSKTDAILVAVFAALLLAEIPPWHVLVALLLASAGVFFLSARPAARGELSGPPLGGLAAIYGIAAGAGFAFSAVCYRAAAVEVSGVSPWVLGGWGVLIAQSVQTLMLCAWLAWRDPQALTSLARRWQAGAVAGAAGALASISWFTAYAMTSAANVRTLGLVEVLFSYLVSSRLLRERLTGREKLGLVFVLVGILLVCLQL